jgi:hypothetical protein
MAFVWETAIGAVIDHSPWLNKMITTVTDRRYIRHGRLTERTHSSDERMVTSMGLKPPKNQS